MEGKPDVIDGATLRIAGTTIHLFAVRAPAPGHRCPVPGDSADCAFLATNALAFLTAYQWVQCRDEQYRPDGSVTARCYLGGRYDIAVKMLRAGWVTADRALAPEYIPAEDAARAKNAGMWGATGR